MHQVDAIYKMPCSVCWDVGKPAFLYAAWSRIWLHTFNAIRESLKTLSKVTLSPTHAVKVLGGGDGMYFFPHNAAALYSGPGPSQYRGFTITLRRTALGRTPLDEWSAWPRDLYLTTHNIYKRKRHPPAEFEPEIPESLWLQTYAV